MCAEENYQSLKLSRGRTSSGFSDLWPQVLCHQSHLPAGIKRSCDHVSMNLLSIRASLHQGFQLTSGASNVKANILPGNDRALVGNHQQHPEPTSIRKLSQRSTLTTRTEWVTQQPGSGDNDSCTSSVFGYSLKSYSGSLACILQLHDGQWFYTQHFCSN